MILVIMIGLFIVFFAIKAELNICVLFLTTLDNNIIQLKYHLLNIQSVLLIKSKVKVHW